MSDSRDKISFRHGWLPVGRSTDALLNLMLYADQFELPVKSYYFKPIESFDVPGMSDDNKFEHIDSHIVDEFGCDPDDVITLSSDRYRGIIVVAEDALRRAGIKLPRPPETPRHANKQKFRLALVPS
jgi:hypothetical protein